MNDKKIEQIRESLAKTIVKPRPIIKELQTSFLDYSMSVIVSRAIPDARDGCKPVHRRVLYAAYGLGMTSDKAYKKSARLVGEVIGKYHPHGDSAVYETMVRLAQDFSMRYPLVDGHGNFGSIDGDSAAAMRYTEARLSKLADTLLNDIDKNTVDFVDNYDGSEKEPVILPSLFPNLLANGSSGIAVGMATNIPPHNFSELVAAIKLVALNSEASIDQIKEVLKGPDFPTKAEIVGESGINNYFNTGRGSIIIRAKYHIETKENNKSIITITEIPYLVNKVNLIHKIVELVRDNVIDGIADLRDESSWEGIRIIIETKRDVVPEVLINKLFKMTQLQTTFSVNMLALVYDEPKLLNIKEAIKIYLEHQVQVLTRKTQFNFKKAQEKQHLTEGLNIASKNIDDVIKIIKEANDNTEAATLLINKYQLSEIQAKAILEMRLRSLLNAERNKIEEELKALAIEIEEYKEILSSYEKKIEIIIAELDKLNNRFGDERKTIINYDASASIDDEDLIQVEDVVITMSSKGYFKRLPVNTYHTQKRGGVGVIGLQTYEDDDVQKIATASSHSDILLFSSLGKVYRIRGHKIPSGSRQAKGVPAINLVNIAKNERIITFLPVNDYSNGSLLFISEKGITKKTKLKEFIHINVNGKIAFNTKENDHLFGVIYVDDTEEIIIGGSNGNLVRFESKQVRNMGRSAVGVKSIKLGENDKVVGLSSSRHGDYVLSVGNKGIGKITPLEYYRLTSRNSKGVKTIKENEKTGQLVATRIVKGDEDILLITTSGKIIRFSLSDVRETSRNASGVKLMNLNSREFIKSVALFRNEKAIGDFKQETIEEQEAKEQKILESIQEQNKEENNLE